MSSTTSVYLRRLEVRRSLCCPSLTRGPLPLWSVGSLPSLSRPLASCRPPPPPRILLCIIEALRQFAYVLCHASPPRAGIRKSPRPWPHRLTKEIACGRIGITWIAGYTMRWTAS
jgi:hypothetical protein